MYPLPSSTSGTNNPHQSLLMRLKQEALDIEALDKNGICGSILSLISVTSKEIQMRIVFPVRPRICTLSSVCSFKVILKEGFPEKLRPEIICETLESFIKFPEKYINQRTGETELEMFQTGRFGWLTQYPLQVMIYSLYRLLLVDPDKIQPPLECEPLPPPSSSSSSNIQHPLSPQAHTATMYPELRVRSGTCEEQGPRPTMEDATIKLDRVRVDSLDKLSTSVLSFHAVFDGHGGSGASTFAARELHVAFFQQVRRLQTVRQALWKACEVVELKLRELSGIEGPGGSNGRSWLREASGTTACIVVIDFSQSVTSPETALPVLYCANIGDSRAVLFRHGEPLPIELSLDQRADNPEEIARVAANSGFVAHGRVMGMLAVARALGDMELKEDGQRFVSSVPEITSRYLSPRNDEFIVIACDGVWDVMPTVDVMNFVRRQLFELNATPEDAARALVRYCLNVLKSQDNVSCIVLQLSWASPIHSSIGSDMQSPAPPTFTSPAMVPVTKAAAIDSSSSSSSSTMTSINVSPSAIVQVTSASTASIKSTTSSSTASSSIVASASAARSLQFTPPLSLPTRSSSTSIPVALASSETSSPRMEENRRSLASERPASTPIDRVSVKSKADISTARGLLSKPKSSGRMIIRRDSATRKAALASMQRRGSSAALEMLEDEFRL